MKITENFIKDVRAMIRYNSLIINSAQVTRRKIPKMVGFQTFLKRYVKMTAEQQLEFAPELKRRMIRQNIVMYYVKKGTHSDMQCYYYNSYVAPIMRSMFQRMNDIPGDRSVPLTPKMSCIRAR
jgi:hypothetical protein